MGRGRLLLRASALAILYVAAARVGLSLSFAHGSVSPVWPPAGIALAALLVYGRSLWIGVAAGALLANLTTDAPAWTAFGIALGNTLEAVCASEIIRRVVGPDVRLDRVRHVVVLLAAGAVGATLIAATIGVATLCLAGSAPRSAFADMWWVWWAGDANGVLVVTPLFLGWRQPGFERPTTARMVEATLLVLLVAAATLIAFNVSVDRDVLFRPLAFLPFPFLIWAAMRFGLRGAATASVVVWVLATIGMRHRSGTFAIAREQVALLLAFQAIVSGTALLLAAAREQVVQQAKRYRGLVAGLPDVVALLTSDGTIAALHAPQGAPAHDASLVGRAVDDVLPADVAARVKEELAAALAGGGVRVVVLQPTVDGARREIEARFVASGPHEVTVVCRDVTELHAMQAKLLVSERLASVGMLAAGVAHEINNPLTWVMGKLELAIRRARDGAAVPPQLLADARTGAERIAGIVRDLLRIARPDSGDSELVALPTVMDLALTMATPAMPPDLRVEKEYGEAPLVRGSGARLGQVFLNLVVNACHAMRDVPGPHVLRLSIDADSQGRARVRVADTGPGISADARVRLFEPFFTTKAAGAGTGLGLAICHRIVSAHGGEITLDSAPEGGAVARVLLPASQPAASREQAVAAPPVAIPQPTSPESESRGRRELFIVDDEPDIVELLGELLADRYRVTGTTDPRDALARLMAGAPADVVLCDLVMPHLSGTVLYEQACRARPELLHRFIFMSGADPQKEDALVLRERRLMQIFKPLDLERLDRALAAVADRTPSGAPIARAG